MKYKSDKKIVLAILAFYLVAGSVRLGKILFSPEILDSWTVAMFGPDNRINVYHREGFEYPELQDHIPALKNKFIVLDRTVYSYKSTIDGFLRDEVFYAYGECGFYMIYAYPFKIRLYPGERCSEAEKLKKFYKQDEFQIVLSQEELTQEERRVYTELQKNCQIKSEKRPAAFPPHAGRFTPKDIICRGQMAMSLQSLVTSLQPMERNPRGGFLEIYENRRPGRAGLRLVPYGVFAELLRIFTGGLAEIRRGCPQTGAAVLPGHPATRDHVSCQGRAFAGGKYVQSQMLGIWLPQRQTMNDSR